MTALAGELGEDWRARHAGICCDSRAAKQGDLFFALPGTKSDGSAFAADAVARGATGIVSERAIEGIGAPVHVVSDARRTLALASAEWFGAQPELMVAVTGTAGKTSVTGFVRQIWSALGREAAQIGTTGVFSSRRSGGAGLTTPDPIVLHRTLSELHSEGVTHASIEASSHGLQQRRLDGVRIAAGAFTNLGRDHLDYHADMEDYHRAKMRLFDLVEGQAPAIINADDEWSEPTTRAVRERGIDVASVGRAGEFITIKRVEHERHRQIVELRHDGKTHRVALPLAGDFQVSNALVAAGLVIATGGDAARTFAALEHLEGAQGRLELVGSTPDGAAVYVDYAHKPDALRNVLEAVRPFTTGRVVVVFGCGGDRDPGKRPIMGGIATNLADEVVVTDDNPRSEEPAVIRRHIMEGAAGASEIADRGEAIARTIASLGRGDTLVIAGKGHETGQTANGVTTPFSDHDAARRALASLDAGKVA